MPLERKGQRNTEQHPTRHVGWVFAGRTVFEGYASVYLAQGFKRRERLIYVADDPIEDQWPKDLRNRGDLLVLSIVEIYGPEKLAIPARLRPMFEAVRADAVRDGYTGIRVAADNSSVVDTPERLAAWLRWEGEAERIAEASGFTGMCAFDATRVDATDLQTVMGVHRAMAPRAESELESRDL